MIKLCGIVKVRPLEGLKFGHAALGRARLVSVESAVIESLGEAPPGRII